MSDTFVDKEFLELLFKEWIDDPISNDLILIDRREFGVEGQSGGYVVSLWKEAGILCDGDECQDSYRPVRVLSPDK
jgi:hypothetical protein